jgi:hypothetical protein
VLLLVVLVTVYFLLVLLAAPILVVEAEQVEAKQQQHADAMLEPGHAIDHHPGDRYTTGEVVGPTPPALCQTASSPPSVSVSPLQEWAKGWSSQNKQLFCCRARYFQGDKLCRILCGQCNFLHCIEAYSPRL